MLGRRRCFGTEETLTIDVEVGYGLVGYGLLKKMDSQELFVSAQNINSDAKVA